VPGKLGSRCGRARWYGRFSFQDAVARTRTIMPRRTVAGSYASVAGVRRRSRWPPRRQGYTSGRSWRPAVSGSQAVQACYARSALGPCHNGRAWAWAVTNGRPRFRGTAGRGPFGSSTWDNPNGRFGLWSRRSGEFALGLPAEPRRARLAFSRSGATRFGTVLS
jgi:hypothetical protein